MAKIKKSILKAANQAWEERNRNATPDQDHPVAHSRPRTAREINEWLRGLPPVDPENPQY